MKERFLTSLKRAVRFGWKNFYRESGLSFVAVFVLTVVVLLASSLFIIGDMAEAIIEDMEDKADVTVDFELAVPEERIFEIRDELNEKFEIKEIEYVSREDTKNIFIERFGDRADVMEALDEVGNPFPASLNIKADDPYIYRQATDFLETEHTDLIYNIDFYHREEVIEGIFGLTESIRKGGMIVGAILGLVAVLLVYNTIKLAIYGLREEIKVMHLVGSSNLFIQGSFIIQGAIMGFVAALVSFALLFLAVLLIPQPYDTAITINFYERFIEMTPTLAMIQLGVGIFLGVFSSLIATGRYLRN